MECKYCNLEKGFLTETQHSKIFLGSQLHKGHIKLLSKRHATKLNELTDEEFSGFTLDLKKASKAVNEVFKPDKLNYALYGNWESHLHWHIYPRYKDKPDWGQPPYLRWKVDGKRVAPPELDMKPSPLSESEAQKLKDALTLSFDD